MVEIIEYAVAFAVSSALAASGIVLLQNYYPLMSEMAARSDFVMIANAAEESLVSNRTRTLTVDLELASMSCHGSVLALSSGAGSYSSALNGQCDFSFSQIYGWHRITFAPDNGLLQVEVDA